MFLSVYYNNVMIFQRIIIINAAGLFVRSPMNFVFSLGIYCIYSSSIHIYKKLVANLQSV